MVVCAAVNPFIPACGGRGLLIIWYSLRFSLNDSDVYTPSFSPPLWHFNYISSERGCDIWNTPLFEKRSLDIKSPLSPVFVYLRLRHANRCRCVALYDRSTEVVLVPHKKIKSDLFDWCQEPSTSQTFCGCGSGNIRQKRVDYYLRQEGNVYDSVCLFVSRLTEKLLGWFSWNLVDGCVMGQGRTD